MNMKIKKLKEYLETFPKDRDDMGCVLDVLYHYFTLEHSIETATIRANFKDLGKIIENLSFDDNNTLFCTIVQLCEEHAKEGFLEGIRVGVVLTSELNGTLDG